MSVGNWETRPNTTADDIMELMHSVYGLKVLYVKILKSYDHQNVYINVDLSEYENANILKPCSTGYVLKIMNSHDSALCAQHVEGEINLTRKLNENGLACPSYVPDKCGRLFSQQELPSKTNGGKTAHIIRLLEYIKGEILSEVSVNSQLIQDGGSWLADMHNILEGYEDPYIKSYYTFHYEAVPHLRKHLHLVLDEHDRDLLQSVLDKWDSLEQQMSSLPRGVIHYDMNEQNVLVRKFPKEGWKIVAIIDFDDSSNGLKIFDLAIYIVYMTLISDCSLDTGYDCLHGFMKKRELTKAELDVLYYCVVMRLVISLVNGLMSYSKEPDPYFLETQKPGWKALRALWALPAEKILERWLGSKLAHADSQV
ncbi:hydroxylysine kinase-like [Watersipora subatra]|uniref:hydroxylysine kinase-like n=1 Tax=Watersipora subatra TaxID=2589382 RepID=UPI00355C5349